MITHEKVFRTTFSSLIHLAFEYSAIKGLNTLNKTFARKLGELFIIILLTEILKGILLVLLEFDEYVDEIVSLLSRLHALINCFPENFA